MSRCNFLSRKRIVDIVFDSHLLENIYFRCRFLSFQLDVLSVGAQMGGGIISVITDKGKKGHVFLVYRVKWGRE